ncbi:MAG: ShlB/FhaC/HecB family hemolysin secretion/activation protein [Nitrospirae bacterium]|nr:ShlB/FhaC/HecB family hemolysin secretion/activation protein [Nitrospirota bacterium]
MFSNEELSKITSKYTGTEITFEQLQQLRYELTLFYTDKGYINSGAIIPDQKVTEGTIEIRIIEGTLTQIEIVGQRHIDASYLTGRLSLYAGPPLNVYELQRGLQLLLQDPIFSKSTQNCFREQVRRRVS